MNETHALATATAANNFQITLIQPMHLRIIDFGLAHGLLSPSFIHLCTIYMHNTGAHFSLVPGPAPEETKFAHARYIPLYFP